jgi:hypothetical protein
MRASEGPALFGSPSCLEGPSLLEGPPVFGRSRTVSLLVLRAVRLTSPTHSQSSSVRGARSLPSVGVRLPLVARLGLVWQLHPHVPVLPGVVPRLSFPPSDEPSELHISEDQRVGGTVECVEVEDFLFSRKIAEVFRVHFPSPSD